MTIDKELIKQCIKQERRAQYELYKQCYAPMMRICLRYHKNDEDAKEVMNQAFLKVCTNLDRYDDQVPFEAWVKRITINMCIDVFRKEKSRKEISPESEEALYNMSSQNVDYNDGAANLDTESLRKLIRELPNVSQKVFNLAVLDGYPYDEVAEMLEISETTCRWHVHHARKQLQVLIKKTFQTLQTIML